MDLGRHRRRPGRGWTLALAALLVVLAGPAAARPDLLRDGFRMGVNYAGLDSWFNGDGHVPGVNYAVPAEGDFDYLASRGVRLVRLPFRWEHLCPTGPDGPLDAGYLEQLRRVVRWAAARDMGVVLDMHNYGAYRGHGFDGKADIGRPGAPTAAQLAATWGRLAAATKDWDGLVGFDTMNEPIAVPDLRGLQQGVVDAIRAAGATQPIALEGNHYSTAGTWVADGNEALYDVTDRLDRLIIEAHVYPDCDSSGTHGQWAIQSTDPSRDEVGGTTCRRDQAVTVGTGAARVAVFLRSALSHGKRVWLGEVGAAAGPPWRLAVDEIVQAVRAAGGPVTYWTAGAGYGSYPFTVMPQAPGQQPGDVVDTPMVGNVTKYTGFTAIPYGWVGPRHGRPRTPSDPFTLVVHGFLPHAVRITPGDGGAGGRFDPPTVVVPAGFNGSPDGMAPPALRFTYTPPARPGVISLTATNDGGLVDPAPRRFATLDDALLRSGLTPVAIFSPDAIDATHAGATALFAGASRLASLPNAASGGHGALGPAAPSHWYPGTPAAPVAVPRGAALDGGAGWRLDRSRLEAPVDLAGQTAACLFVTGIPAGAGSLVGWASPAGDTVWRFPGARGSWDLRLDGGPALSLGPAPDRSRLHAYAMCFDRGAATLFVDGVPVARGAAGAAALPPNQPREGRGFPPLLAVGFNPAYNDAGDAGYAAGTLRSIVVTSGAWTPEAVATLSRGLLQDPPPPAP